MRKSHVALFGMLAAGVEIVDAEDKSKPLSDEEISKALAAKSVSIARRTVTKYREALDIPSSRQRRVWA